MGREGRAAARLPHFGQFAPVPQRRPFGADVPGSWSDDDLRLSWKVSARRWRGGRGAPGRELPGARRAGTWRRPGAPRGSLAPVAPSPPRAPPSRPPLPSPPRRRTTLPRTARCGRFSSGTAPPLPELEPRGSRAPSRRGPAVCRPVPRSSEATAYRCLPRPPRVSLRSLESHWCSWRPPGGSRVPSSRQQTARSSLAGAPAPRLRAALPHRPASSRCQELERGCCTHRRIGGPCPLLLLGKRGDQRRG